MILNNIHSYACMDFIFHGMSWLPEGVRKAYFLGLHEWVGPLSETFTFFWSINCWSVTWRIAQKWNKQKPCGFVCFSLSLFLRSHWLKALGDALLQWAWLKSGRDWYWGYLLVSLWLPRIEKEKNFLPHTRRNLSQSLPLNYSPHHTHTSEFPSGSSGEDWFSSLPANEKTWPWDPFLTASSGRAGCQQESCCWVGNCECVPPCEAQGLVPGSPARHKQVQAVVSTELRISQVQPKWWLTMM